MRFRAGRFLLVAATFVAAVSPFSTSSAAPGSTARSSDTSGEPNGASPPAALPDTTSPDLSLDGLSVAFSSDASNLVSGDTNNAADVFVRKTGGALKRVSTTSSGAQANGASYSPSLSVDGRYLAFVSTATNLVSGDTNGFADVFLKDLSTGKIQRISVSSSGAEANGASNSPFVSLFGEYVTFESAATNLAGGDTNGLSDAFFRDVARRKTWRITPPAIAQDVSAAPEKVWSEHARVSYEGRYVAYTRGATRGLTEEPTALDVFVWDRSTGKHAYIDVKPWAGAFKNMSHEPVISADGHYVAFTRWSAWTNDQTVSRLTLNAGIGRSPLRNDDTLARNTLDFKQILMYDRISKVLIPISVNPAGVLNGDSYSPSISADGHQIAFVSEATNLVPGDTNNAPDVFVRDLEDRTTSRASVTSSHAQSNGASTRPSLSYEGRRVAFGSAATNLVGGDTGNLSDVFLRDRKTDTINRAPRIARSRTVCGVPLTPGNHTPCPITGVNIGDQITIDLTASDADRDPLRFGAIVGMPSNATIDPLTGIFSWTAAPDPTYFVGAATLYLPQGRTKEFGQAISASELGINTNPTQEASQRGRHVAIVFWVQDPRGAIDLVYVRYFVRDVEQSSRCTVKRTTPAGTEKQINDALAPVAEPLADGLPDDGPTSPDAVYPVQLPGTCFTPNK